MKILPFALLLSLIACGQKNIVISLGTNGPKEFDKSLKAIVSFDDGTKQEVIIRAEDNREVRIPYEIYKPYIGKSYFVTVSVSYLEGNPSTVSAKFKATTPFTPAGYSIVFKNNNGKIELSCQLFDGSCTYEGQ